LIGVVLLNFGSAQLCTDETLLPVTTQGFAAITTNAGAARDEALRDAQRQAVGQVLGVFVESQTLVVNAQLVADQISTRASGFVQSFSVTDETKDDAGGTYTVTIDACVSQEALKTDLESLGAILREQLGNPRVVIQAEESENKVVSDAATTLLSALVLTCEKERVKKLRRRMPKCCLLSMPKPPRVPPP
jgi:hypothetical protein